MTRLAAVALALLVLAGTHAAAFALGAASTRIPPTVRVDTPDSLRPPVVQSEQKGKTTPVVGAVRVRVGGTCTETGQVEAAQLKLKDDPSCH